MYLFHRKNNRREHIVGWYTTTTAKGEFINDNSSLIHDFYSSECENPIHIVVDTTLSSENVNTRGFVGKTMAISNNKDDFNVLANTFEEIKVNLDFTEAEATCLYTMINGQKKGSEWKKSEIISTLPTQNRVVQSIEKLNELLENIQNYVDGVVEGRINPSREIGVELSNAIDVLTVHDEKNEKTAISSVNQSKTQDLLMVSYLTSLAQSQILISEKLNSVL
jgi:translation initiation factor 3 subunit F